MRAKHTLQGENPIYPQNTDIVRYPTYSRREIERENWLARMRVPLVLELDTVTIKLTPIAVEPVLMQGGAFITLGATMAGDAILFCVPATPLLGFMGENLPDITLADVDPKILPLLIEECLGVLISLAERHFGPIRLESVELQDEAPEEAHTAFRVEGFGPAPFPILIAKGHGHLADLDKAINILPIHAMPLPKMALELALRIGVTSLTIGELEDLSTGDALVMETSFIKEQKIIAVLANRFAEFCTFSKNTVTLNGSLLTLPDPITKHFIMEHAMAEPHTLSAGLPPASLREVNMRVIFEIGRLDIALEQLETIGPGYVFDIGKQQQNVIDIIAGGRKIGTGDLVRIADSIGVRVTALNR